jgi:hypothetical protein
VIRTILRIVGVALWICVASAAMSQQSGALQTQASSDITMLSYPDSDIASQRLVRTRTESGGRELVTETIEVPSLNGGYKPYVETTIETVRFGDSVRIKRDVMGRYPDGRPQLIESTQADQENLPDGTSRTVENKWTPDLNGRLQLSQRQLQETKSTAANVKQTNIATFLPGINEPLREARRFEQTERQVTKDFLQNDSVNLVPDANGRWQPLETRNQEVRATGANESIEEEVVSRVNANGALSPAERRIIRRSAANGQEDVVIETYSQSGGASVDGPLELNQRLRRNTVTTADGGRQTVEEMEARNLALDEPLRLVSKTVETVRAIGPDRWETVRQEFVLDSNGRFVLGFNANGEANRK